jgi:hypothetical protein
MERLKIKLAVTVPAETEVKVNGTPVLPANGTWRSDTLKPGSYTISAALAGASDECPTAKLDTTLMLRPSFDRKVSLTPRACGTIELVFRGPSPPDDAKYGLASLDGQGFRAGPLPALRAVRVVVPIGRWLLTTSKPKCVAYGPDTVVVAAGKRQALTFGPLICG